MCAVKHQAISGADIERDLYCLLASLGHIELITLCNVGAVYECFEN